jgi:hypothetical protein
VFSLAAFGIQSSAAFWSRLLHLLDVEYLADCLALLVAPVTALDAAVGTMKVGETLAIIKIEVLDFGVACLSVAPLVRS